MSNQPTVCAVMLVNGRPEMTRRAIASFRAQTYENKRLVIWDTTPGCGSIWSGEGFDDRHEIYTPDVNKAAFEGSSIGNLRNAANKYALSHYTTRDTCADLIAHFDSDDWSHPRRLEEQVALLLASGKQCVGYRELLFWDTREACPSYCEEEFGHTEHSFGEAWLYRDFNPRVSCGGTWLYRRELWEQYPFMDAPHEDRRWLENLEVSRGMLAVSGLGECVMQGDSVIVSQGEPRFVAQMHAGGTEQISRDVMLRGDVWHRVSQFDQYCAEKMDL